MVIHLIAAGKLSFLQIFKLSPLLWPLNLYLPVARHLPRLCQALSYFSTFFAFRLQRILTAPLGGGPDDRLQRALRLLLQQLTPRRRPDVLDDTSINAFLTVAL